MDLDPSLAFTALLEMWPAAPAGTSAKLAAAMTAANPKDRWAFARDWIATAKAAAPPAAGDPFDRLDAAHAALGGAE
jgi:hypothetical protein